MVKRAVDAFGSVQFLFNSAGAAIRRAKFLEIDDALLDKTFDLNVKGTFYCMQAVLPHMLPRTSTASSSTWRAWRTGAAARARSVHYAAAKGAVVTMTMGVAREFATQGIRALSISPGPIKTPFQAAAQSLARADAAVPGGRADEAFRRTRGDRRTGPVHVLGRLSRS